MVLGLRRIGAAALLCGLAAGASAQEVPDRRPTLAVMYFNNSSLVDRASYDALSAGIADILITDLARNRDIRVVERHNLQRLLAEQDLTTERRVEEETAVRIGKILGAQHMIVGGFIIDRAGSLRLDARAVHVETSRIVHVESVRGRTEELLTVIDELASRLQRGLKLAANTPAPRPSGEAPAGGRFRAVMLYSRALIEDDKKDSSAVATYERFLEETPATFSVEERHKATTRVRELRKGTQQ